MELEVVRLSTNALAPPDVGVFPRTRAEALGFVEKIAAVNCREVHILATSIVGEDGVEIERARLEMVRKSTHEWRLQYISHPRESSGLTSQMWPEDDDFEWRASRFASPCFVEIVEVCSSEVMAEEGLRPCSRLDLRASNAFPVVPRISDIARLLSSCPEGCGPLCGP